MNSADRVHIEIRAEGMEAWVRISEGDLLGDQQTLREMLAEAGIRFGIDERAVTRLGDRFGDTLPALDEEQLAQGTAPAPGEPERLELAHVTTLQPGTLRVDGSLDYRERQLIIPVEEGTELGRIWPAGEGKPGMDVLGEPIPPEEPAPLLLKLGEGVIRDSEDILRANRAGARTLAPDGTLDVVERHVHPGNVNLASGSLRSEGSLEIGRDIEIGMRVEARGDIVIKGSVDGACVRAGGSIQIGSGAIGRERGAVYAGGDLEVRHALGISLTAKGTLRVARSVSASKLTAHTVEVGGRLLGDSIFAEARILVAGDAGSPAGGPCWLRVAYPMDDAEQGGAVGVSGLASSVKPVSSLGPRKGRSPQRESRGSAVQGASRGRGVRGESSSASSAQELEARITWRRKQRALQETAVIEVRGKAHAGCRIDFGGKPRVLETAVGPCCFRFDSEQDTIIETEI